MRDNKKTNWLVISLIIVIVILLGIILYTFVIKPQINGYVINKQIEAKDYVLATLLMQIQQQGYTQIADTEGNSVILVPYVPQEQTNTDSGQQTLELGN